MAKKSKRDDFIADSDEDLEQGSGSEEAAFTDGGSDDEDRKPKVTKSKKDSKAKGKPDSQDVKPKQESKQPAAKKRKVKEEDDDEAESKPKASSSSMKLKRNDEGDLYADLDKYKRVTVRQFKDKTLIDIREYYTDRNTEMQKPGKKGIALSVEAWEALKGVMSAVDNEAQRLENK